MVRSKFHRRDLSSPTPAGDSFNHDLHGPINLGKIVYYHSHELSNRSCQGSRSSSDGSRSRAILWIDDKAQALASRAPVSYVVSKEGVPLQGPRTVFTINTSPLGMMVFIELRPREARIASQSQYIFTWSHEWFCAVFAGISLACGIYAA